MAKGYDELPMRFAQPGEIFLTNSCIDSREGMDQYKTLEGARKYFEEEYKDFEIRFDFDHVCIGVDVVDSKTAGRRMRSRGKEFGTIGFAIYGKPRK